MFETTDFPLNLEGSITMFTLDLYKQTNNNAVSYNCTGHV
jgi:hypothetical protein